MRVIGTVESEKKAFIVYTILLEEGIHSSYERFYDGKENREGVAIWIYEEDQKEKAKEILEIYKQNPEDPRYEKIEFPEALPQRPDRIAQSRAKGSQDDTAARPWKTKSQSSPQKLRSFPITYFIILTCIFLFILNGVQQANMIRQDGELAVQLGSTPLQQALMFDDSKSQQKVNALLEQYSLKGVKELKDLPADQLRAFELARRTPNFQGYLPYLVYRLKKVPPPVGISGPLFGKIREGEIWRLFTPCLLHGGVLHILFNMAWAWLLLKQVEQRLPKWKTLTLMVAIGIISNVAQYLVSGPNFLGFSGVVVGLVGFIWVRQRICPWEGYPLQKSTFLFILVFVLAMSALEIFSLVTALITAKEISAHIANTAHIVGGIAGLLLGRLSFFSRSIK